MIYIISKETFGDYGIRDIQSNSCWTECTLDGYAVIPDEMVEDIIATKGFCDIVLNDEETEVVSFTARELPDLPECFKDGFLKLSGGTMAGMLNMGGNQIRNAKTVNGVQIHTFKAGAGDTEFVFNRVSRKDVCFIFALTQSGPCLYLLSVNEDTRYYDKLFGDDDAVILNPHVTDNEWHITVPKYGHCCVLQSSRDYVY